jgi:single-stranded DNA-binding protein
MSLNRATIIGYLGQDLELRNPPTNGQPVVSFAVATDESLPTKTATVRSASTGTGSWCTGSWPRPATSI